MAFEPRAFAQILLVVPRGGWFALYWMVHVHLASRHDVVASTNQSTRTGCRMPAIGNGDSRVQTVIVVRHMRSADMTLLMPAVLSARCIRHSDRAANSGS